MKKATFALFVPSLLVAGIASAHIGIANNTLPISAAGQTTFAVANATSEILFLVPHGCSTEGGDGHSGVAVDTTKIEVTVPAAIVTATGAASVRPSHAGEFGNVVRTTLGDGSIKFTWTKKDAASDADDQLYKVSIRMKFPASTNGTSITKYQFDATQTCTNGGTDYTKAWGAESPSLLAFPEKRKGFNKYTLDSSTVSDFTVAGSATKAAKLKGYFGDAAILWVGKRGYSANTNTEAKINTLSTSDRTYSNLGTEAGVSLTTSEEIWVKY